MRLISLDNRRASCQRSTSRWRLSHSTGPLPQSFPSRSAIAAVTGCFSRNMLCNVWRVTPKSLAISILSFPSAGRTSSRNSAPGCMGGRFGSRRAAYSAILLLLVVLLVIYPIGIVFLELERDAPRTIDVQCIAPITEAMEIEAWDIEVLRQLGPVQRLQSRHDPL